MPRTDYEAEARKWLDRAEEHYKRTGDIADAARSCELATAIAQAYAILEVATATDAVAQTQERL